MENATEALIMAASVLLLVIALTVNISSFSRMRADLDSMIKYDETMDLAVDEDGQFINYIKADEDVRIVDASTVITSIRRGIKENYNVYVCPQIGLGAGLAKFINENKNNLGTAIITQHR